MKQRLFPILILGVVILACIAFYFGGGYTEYNLAYIFFLCVSALLRSLFGFNNFGKNSADYYICTCYGSTDTFQYLSITQFV